VAPDASGRTVAAIVPPGMSPGEKFIVEIPPAKTVQQPTQKPISHSGVNPTTPAIHSAMEDLPPTAPPPQSVDNISEENHGRAVINVTVPPGVPPGASLYVQVPGEEGRTVKAVVPPGVSEFQVPYEPANGSGSSSKTTSTVAPTPAHAQTMSPPQPSQMQGAKAGQSLMLVRVPPGTSPGSTIHVQIPGENRRVAAVVPPDVSEFHVAYDPAPAKEKQLLVKVPPGTQPGSIIHVQIPGENRVVSATVPPGVSEFMVSYPAES